ncbi:MAG: DUF99 family protein [Nanoarchaeota archaeon]|nr:DUF99 family protein [Nanoarchaeota archaeon]MCK5629889.1 DUF99 family protein [Nanoarchaeota archaeon]
MKQLKKFSSIVGFDDSPFNKFKDKDLLVVGTVMRGGSSINGIMSTRVQVDGNDATTKLICLIKKSKFRTQLKAILLDGIAFGGFNIIDMHKLHKKTGIPVIVIIRRLPDFENIMQILEKIGKKSRIKLIEKAGKAVKIGKIYTQHAGCDMDYVKQVIRIATINAEIPEPLRISHLISAGIVRGESKGDS